MSLFEGWRGMPAIALGAYLLVLATLWLGLWLIEARAQRLMLRLQQKIDELKKGEE